MCQREACAMCGKAKLGLPMAWMEELDALTWRERSGFVCYGCEDRVCHEIAAGRSAVLETK